MSKKTKDENRQLNDRTANADTKNNNKKGKNRNRKEERNKRDDVNQTKDRMETQNGSKTEWPSYRNEYPWYARNPQLNKDAASFNFSQPLGLRMDLTTPSVNVKPFIIPGVMTIEYIPGIGWNSPDDPTSTIDFAANSIYAYVVHANSRTKSYDAPDYMMYCLACTDMYAAYADLVRAYGIARWYNSYNRYYPGQILKALGYSLDDILANMANYRYRINRLAVALTSLNVPNVFPIYARQSWLPQHLFLDHPGMKAQTYAFVPSILHKYVGFESQKGGYLKGEPWMTKTIDEKLEWVESALNVLLADQDIGIMSGDTLKAFGEDKMLRVHMISEEYQTVPVYDKSEYTLSQIENLTAFDAIHVHKTIGGVDMDTVTDIYQDPDSGNRLFYTPTFNLPTKWASYTSMQKIINIRHDNPTVEDMFEATRLTSASIATPFEGGTLHEMRYIGTEMVGTIRITTLDPNEGTHGSYGFRENIVTNTLSDTDRRSFCRLVSSLSNFRCHPILFGVTSYRDEYDDMIEVWPVTEMANYTLLDHKELNAMHDVALLSEFNIPLLGTMETK